MTVQRIICGGDFWEMRETLRSRAGYAPHVHDTFSAGQILAGQSECLVAGKTHALGAGHCVWIRAGEVHACNPGPDGQWSYRMLHVDAGWMRSLGISGDSSGVSRDAELWKKYEALAGLMEAGVDAALIEEAIVLLLGALHPAGAGEDSREGNGAGGAMREVKRFIEERVCEKITLDALATRAGISPWHLVRSFQNCYGMTPHAFQLCLKTNAARRLMRQGMGPCDAALAAGFADQSHLTRMFRRYVSLTPGVYQRALRLAVSAG